MSKESSKPEEDLDRKEQDVSDALAEEQAEDAEETKAEETEEQPAPEEEIAAKPEEKEEAAEAEEEGEEEEEIEVVEERVYTIPFRRVWATPRGKRTPRALRMLRDFVRRNMKTEKVEISNEVNEELWARSIKKPPRQITVRLVKDKEGRVIVYPATAA